MTDQQLQTALRELLADWNRLTPHQRAQALVHAAQDAALAALDVSPLETKRAAVST